MLNRQHRFHGYGSLRRVYSHSQSVRGVLIGLRFAPRNPGKTYRVAVVVAKKVNKSAVKRNRIRRRIFEIIRNIKDVPTSTDLILTVYSDEVRDMPQLELEALIVNLIQKTHS